LISLKITLHAQTICKSERREKYFVNFNRFHAVSLLLLLAILDSLFTDFGIRNNHISEANPLMRYLYGTSIPAFYLIKIALPLLLLLILTKIEVKKYLNFLIGGTVALYVFILFQHIFWLSIIL